LDLSIVREPFSVAPRQTLTVTIRDFCTCAWQAALEALPAGGAGTTLPEVEAALEYVAVLEEKNTTAGGRLRFDSISRLARGLLAGPLAALQVCG
jgi:hypothetical protein